MFRNALCFLILGLVVIATCQAGLLAVPSTTEGTYAQGTECGSNEEYTYCGTACPRRCNQPGPDICTLQCVIGCQCKEGYLRDSAGNCVASSDC